MSEIYSFLQEDFEKLEEVIRGVQSKLDEALKLIGESTQEDAGTWHDNFAYEQAQRDAIVWSSRLRDLHATRNSAEIVLPYPNKDRAFIGRTVTIMDKETYKTQRFRIGSYYVGGETSGSTPKTLPAVSYAAPLARIIIGARLGEVREGEIAGQKKKFQIIHIE